MRLSDIAPVVLRSLAEDLGRVGDVTSRAVVPEDASAFGNLRPRAPGVVAGLEAAGLAFEAVDEGVEYELLRSDGDRVGRGEVVASVEGPARSILIAERTALNLLGRMSGVATATASFVDAVSDLGTEISDTRKTMPGLRALDKHAVAAGGGVNHRMGLHDAVIIKDNHIAAAGGALRAVEAARRAVGPDMMVAVEVDRLDQLEEVLDTDADRVLLDNMGLDALREAVNLVEGRMVTEASGGVTLDTVRSVAETGVDVISVGWITHSPPQLDIGLDFVS